MWKKPGLPRRCRICSFSWPGEALPGFVAKKSRHASLHVCFTKVNLCKAAVGTNSRCSQRQHCRIMNEKQPQVCAVGDGVLIGCCWCVMASSEALTVGAAKKFDCIEVSVWHSQV